MREPVSAFVDEALPDLDPVMCTELTDSGWRGLTECGEVLEVSSSNGHVVRPPSEIVIHHQGKPLARRKICNDWKVSIGEYLLRFNRTVAFYKHNMLAEALAEADLTMESAQTLRARFNRSMVLLAAGRWHDGFAEYVRCEEHAPFMRPQVKQALAAGLIPWRGEDLRGQKLLVMHAHGFGDTIMCLRYVPFLRSMGADVIMWMPPEVSPVASQFGDVVNNLGDVQDFCPIFCPILHLLRWLKITHSSVTGGPYIEVNPHLVAKWRDELTHHTGAKKVGLAWSVGKPSSGDYPREIALNQLLWAPQIRNAKTFSVQAQGVPEAKANFVETNAFTDFADCAAFMTVMDKIISVDTAALHLAGAIGHPQVVGLLSHWHSWRWIANWYDSVRLVTQSAPEDWASALAQI
jgi:hypothetical protein